MGTTPMGTETMTTPRAQGTPNLGRDKVHWSKEVWDRIDTAVHDEMM